MMEVMREAWTDDRLDDLSRRVEDGFNRVDADLRELRVETKTELTALRGEMNNRFEVLQDRFDARFDRIDARFDALQRVLFQFGGVLVAALIGVIATLIATQV